MSSTVFVQTQDTSGNWRTMSTLMNDESQRMLQAMQELQRRYPNYRVRAVNANGQLLNLL